MNCVCVCVCVCVWLGTLIQHVYTPRLALFNYELGKNDFIFF